MLEIELDGREYKLPTTWDEVPEKIRLQILKLVFATAESGENYLNILKLLLGKSSNEWKKFTRKFLGQNNNKSETNANVLQELLHCIAWMWQDNATKKPFDCIKVSDSKLLSAVSDSLHLPKITGVNYYLFEEGFKTMTFGELTDAYIHAHAYIKQLEEGDGRLDLLLATVARPKADDYRKVDDKWHGDERMPYNAFKSAEIAKDMATVKIEIKILVLVYFLGSLREFLSFYDIFANDGPAKEEEYPGQAHIKNQHLLAEKGIFGNLEQTKAANVHDVFLFLEENKKDIEEMIKQQKAANNDSNGEI